MPDVLDQSTVAMLKDVMEGEFSLLIETFIDDANTRIPSLRKSLSITQMEELMRGAHSLKGSSSNLGATLFSQKCFIVEQLAKQGDISGLEGIIAELEADFKGVEKALRFHL